ncbi:hypothetical protein NPIL_660571, partial [Nephila pilipes]
VPKAPRILGSLAVNVVDLSPNSVTTKDPQ